MMAPILRMTMSACVLAAACVLLAATSLSAKPPVSRNHPGFVDGSHLADLAGPTTELVQVNLGKIVLGGIARSMSKDRPDLAEFLNGIESITAVVVEPEQPASAKKALEDIARDLERRQWEKIAFIRDEDEWIMVFVHGGASGLDGLTVLMHEPDGKSVFANIAGVLDIAQIAGLRDLLDIDDLEGLAKLGAGPSSSYSVAPRPDLFHKDKKKSKD